MKKRGGQKKPPVTAETPLTFREKKFVDAWFRSEPPFNGAEAARVVGYGVKCAKFQAVRMLTRVNLQAEIERRHRAIEKENEVTLEKWKKKGRRYYDFDVRKLVDSAGNPVDLQVLGDNEAAMISGIEVVENFEEVQQADGKKKAVHVGYTKKIKFCDPMKGHEYFGFISDEPPQTDDALKSLTIVFVNAKGERVAPTTIEQTKTTRVIEHPPVTPGVKFVR